LETLLKLRRSTRDSCRIALATAREAQSALEQKEQDLAQQQSALVRQRREASRQGAVDVDCLLHTHRYEAVLRAQQAVVRQQARQLAEETELRRQRLSEADRQVRVLERLSEKQYAKFRHDQGKYEMKELDEVALQQAQTQEIRACLDC
jgi:flagellar export protein FliJ